MQLKVSYEDQPDGITVVRAEGDGGGNATLDAGSAPELRKVLLQLIENGRLILIVDLSAIDGLDSTGLGVLVGALKRVHVKGGAVSLVITSDRTRAILSKTRLNKVFRIHDTLASAVGKLAADYAEKSVEQRCATIAERADRIVPSGGHSYEDVSEHVTVVRVVGELDVYTAPHLRELLVNLVSHGKLFLVLDMTAVDYLDSTGFGVLLGGLKRVRAHDGAMALVVPEERIRKILRITGTAKLLGVFDTVDPAIEHLGREVPKAHA